MGQGGGAGTPCLPVGQGAQGCAAEAEHKGDASNTTAKRDWANQDGPICGIHTRDDRKEAVIGRSQCTVARKLERGITPDGGISMQGWGASAAPLPDTPLSVIDELPLPLLDCGQGKESYAKCVLLTESVDGGEGHRRECRATKNIGTNLGGQRRNRPPIRTVSQQAMRPVYQIVLISLEARLHTNHPVWRHPRVNP